MLAQSLEVPAWKGISLLVSSPAWPYVPPKRTKYHVQSPKVTLDKIHEDQESHQATPLLRMGIILMRTRCPAHQDPGWFWASSLETSPLQSVQPHFHHGLQPNDHCKPPFLSVNHPPMLCNMQALGDPTKAAVKYTNLECSPTTCKKTESTEISHLKQTWYPM